MGEVGGRKDFTPDWATFGPQGELYFPSGWVTEQLPEAVFLRMGAERDGIDLSKIGRDAEITAIFGAGCEAIYFIASKVSAYEVFTDAQRAGLAVGPSGSPAFRSRCIAAPRGSLSTTTRCCEKSENPEARELRARRVA